MKTLGSIVNEVGGELSKSYLVVYFIPSLIFSLISFLILKQIRIAYLFSKDLYLVLEIFIVGFIVSLLLTGLSNFTLQLLDKLSIWRYLLRRGIKKDISLKGDLSTLAELRQEYRRLSMLESDNQILIQVEGLSKQIDDLHNKLANILLSTNFSKKIHLSSLEDIFSDLSQYIYIRYSIDVALFWPRLWFILYEENLLIAKDITYQKLKLDIYINFAFLTSLLIIESIFSLFLGSLDISIVLLSIIIGALLFMLFFFSALDTMRHIANLIKISFDLYRNHLLEKFNVEPPSSLLEEQLLWIDIGLFISRGDVFYFPQNFRQRKTLND